MFWVPGFKTRCLRDIESSLSCRKSGILGASGSTTLTYSRNALNRYMSDPFLETLEARIDFSNFSLSPLH